MPELPDVEVFKRYMEATSLHQTISETEVPNPEMLKNVSAGEFQAKTRGRQFDSTRRHGKYLFAHLSSGDWVMMHFGMTGLLEYLRQGVEVPPHSRVIFNFDNGYRLAYVNQRKLGRVMLTDDVDAFVRKHELGPDVLDPRFDLQAFRRALGDSRGTIKSALMDQERFSGIGNEYSDEILFQSRVHPETKVTSLREQDLKDLFRSMKKVLQTAIDAGADPDRFPASYLLTQRHQAGKCPACGGNVKTIKVSGRTAYFCPKCQVHK